MRSLMHDHATPAKREASPETRGMLMNLGWRYDLIVAVLAWLCTRATVT